ncbi:MAG: SDR family oxidoreductase [Chloroflexota bacterium]
MAHPDRTQCARVRFGRQPRVLSVCGRQGSLASLIRQHAVELAPHGIPVDGVAPTFVEPCPAGKYLEDAVFRAQLEARIPLGRIGQPFGYPGTGEIFVSPAADFITGQVLSFDGGTNGEPVTDLIAVES